MMAHHALTHAQAVRLTWSVLGVALCLEACAVWHFYIEQRDVFAALVVITTWAKDSVAHIVEHFLET